MDASIAKENNKHTKSETKNKFENRIKFLLMCNICPKLIFENERDLRKHKKTHVEQYIAQTYEDEENNFACIFDQCEYMAKTFFLVSSHVMMHVDFRPYACVYCDYKGRDKPRIEAHIRAHTGEKPYKCKICERPFNSRFAIIGHERIHTGEKPFKCDLCKKAFRKRWNMKLHKNLHEGRQNYSCGKCSMSFSFSKEMKKHNEKKDENNIFSCRLCSLIFCLSSNLHNHLSKIHQISNTDKFGDIKRKSDEVENITPKCQKCLKLFSNIQNLRRHEQYVEDCTKPIPEYFCDLCNKKFTNKVKLWKHKRNVHSSIINHRNIEYPCDLCGRKFNYKYELRKHNISHQSDDMYTCKTCTKTFSNLSKFTEHQKSLCFDNMDQLKNKAVLQIDQERERTQYIEINVNENDQKQMLTIDTNTFFCDLCSEAFSSFDAFKKHRSVCLFWTPTEN